MQLSYTGTAGLTVVIGIGACQVSNVFCFGMGLAAAVREFKFEIGPGKYV